MTTCPCGGQTDTGDTWGAAGERTHYRECKSCRATGPLCTTPKAAEVAFRLLTGQSAPEAVELALAKIELRPRDRRGLVALAAKLDVTPQCLDHWQSGHAPTGDARCRLLRLIVSG